MGVAYLHEEYREYAPLWKRCRDVVCGQDEVQQAGQRYLPKLTGEDDESYRARVHRSDFYNATWRTIAGFTGMAFRKPPVIDVPAAIEPFLTDIDLAGCSLDTLAKTVTEEVLEVGRCGLLVDHPALPANVAPLSIKAAQELGMRPTVKFYPAESIRNWKHKTIGNRHMLSMVVLGEEARTPKDEFEDKTEEQYRVLDLDEAGHYRQRVFAVRDGKDVLVSGPFYPLMNGKPMGEIPFVMVGMDGKGDEPDEPPLIDLVDANIAHYQVNSDYRHGLHFAGLPTLFLAGVQQEPGAPAFYIGGSAAITSNDPNAKGEYIEFKGSGLSAIERALASLERRMAVLGARMIADESKQAETLGATQIKRQGENSILADIVIGVSKAMEWALGVMARWVGAAGECKYEINREFLPVMLDAQQVTSLMGAWQGGGLSEAELFDLFQRGDLIDATKTLDEHQTEIDAAPPMPKPGPVAPIAPPAAA
jgi:hypothetical protein